MKKLLIAILAAVLASGAFAQQSFPDIPEGHWAGDAVARIADLNIVIGFPDGTFRGNEAFTRYQAALVVSRMLDVIAENIDAALALTNEDIASLRNAVQELSSDVAAQGTRLSAAEGAIAGLADDVTGQTDRLDELESALANLDTDVDPAVLRDLQNQIASQRVAIDTAQATADQALSRANAAGSQADANAAEIAALNELIQLLGDQVDALEGAGGEGVDAGLAARVARNEGDIANIREFVILLRRDQVALRDRVSALEASDEQQTADIADLQDRVTAIEENPLGLSGEIELEYFVGRFSGAGDSFDIDRAYGVGMPRDMGTSYFSSGTDEEFAEDEDEVDAAGEFAEDRSDIDYGSSFSADVSIDFGSTFGFDAQGSPRGLNSFEAAINFEFIETTIDGDTVFVLALDDFSATFDPIGMEPLTFAFGEEVDAFFTPYTLNREDEIGFVATVGAPDFLEFLDPTLQVAYLSGGYDETDDAGADPDLDNLVEAVTTGIRATVSPLEGLTIGASYVRDSYDVLGGADADLDDNTDANVFGVDLAASLGPVDLAAEYASGFSEGTDLTSDADDYSDDVLFVTADATFDILGGVDFAANYRDIAPGWETAFGLVDADTTDDFDASYNLTDEGDYPFDDDQAGFGVEAGLGLFIFDVGVFFDSYTTTAPDSDISAFGVDTAAELFSGFSLTAFYEQVSVDGAVADSTDAADVTRENSVQDLLDGDYRTGFGVGIVHDADADNALVPGLGLELAYEQLGAGFNETHILADASYALDVSIVSLTPYVTFESYDDADADSDDTSLLAVGTGLSTQPLDIFLAPSLEAAVNYRTTDHSDVSATVADYTSTEMQWSVGLNLNEFLLENSSLSARYGSYTGTNVTDSDANGDGATDLSGGDDTDPYAADAAGTGTQSVSGYEVVWNYFDLELSYGVYTHDADTAVDGDSTTAQAFGVAYTVAF